MPCFSRSTPPMLYLFNFSLTHASTLRLRHFFLAASTTSLNLSSILPPLLFPLIRSRGNQLLRLCSRKCSPYSISFQFHALLFFTNDPRVDCKNLKITLCQLFSHPKAKLQHSSPLGYPHHMKKWSFLPNILNLGTKEQRMAG